jgi:hypothetical protein
MKKIGRDKPSGVITHTYMEISQGNSLCSYMYLKLKCHVFSFYLFSFFSYKSGEQEGRTSPAQGRRAGTSGRGEVLGKEDRRVNMVCAHVSKCK